MEEIVIRNQDINAFVRYLREQEKSQATVEKYVHDTGEFVKWMGERPISRELVLEWKNMLLSSQFAPSTINCRIAAVNALFSFLKADGLRIHAVRIQRKMFRSDSRNLTRQEYNRLVRAARVRGDERLELLFETICSTGIRVSEVKHITVEAAQEGCARICLKGKIRMILIPEKLCRKLMKYAGRKRIAAGEIFLGRGGRSLSRKKIWADMKSVCRQAGVDCRKVFPHNLRHLFARVFYAATKDLVKLADVLGHSSLTTTRIYLISTGEEHRRALNSLSLIS